MDSVAVLKMLSFLIVAGMAGWALLVRNDVRLAVGIAAVAGVVWGATVLTT